ncbi:MAG TPA: cache domain-containing protein [Stellaceae bacterium]|nr:cache domain-containing protein [Stellaceae bacterium]
MTDRQGYPRPRLRTASSAARHPLWPTYLGITGLLLLILVALAGGIIWYNTKKSNELAIAEAHRLMEEVEDKIIDRIKLLYDPMYAIVGIASLAPMLTSPTTSSNPRALELVLRALRIYPQIQSLYVGFDSGEFYMVTHITGEKSEALRGVLHAPHDAVFAVETIGLGDKNERVTRWTFLSQDGAVVGHRDPEPAHFDPRGRPWYDAAKRSDIVEESDLYLFATSGEPGFTLSRSFKGPPAGVMGADLAAIDLAYFLRNQRITAGSAAFIFTKSGEVVAVPNPVPLAKNVAAKDGKIKLPTIADLNDPVIKGFIAAYQGQAGAAAGTRIYDVGGRTYIGRVVAIPPRYGRNQLLAMMVPVGEIERPITEARNETLLYSLAFLVFTVPLYLTLVVAWIDRRLGRQGPRLRFRDDE